MGFRLNPYGICINLYGVYMNETCYSMDSLWKLNAISLENLLESSWSHVFFLGKTYQSLRSWVPQFSAGLVWMPELSAGLAWMPENAAGLPWAQPAIQASSHRFFLFVFGTCHPQIIKKKTGWLAGWMAGWAQPSPAESSGIQASPAESSGI